MTRWAAVLAGVWLAVFVVLFGPLAEHVPMAVIGGLILVVGAELVLGRLPDVRLVLRTAPVSAFAMVITFLATTELPLQQAILLGAVLSLVLYAWQSSRLARLIRLVPTDAGWDTAETPATLPSNAVTVLHYAGVGLFAEVPRIDDSWPDFRGSHDSVLVLSIATMPDVPSTTVLKALGRIADSLEATGGRLVLAGVSPAFRQILERSGFAERLGPSGVVPATDHVFGAVGQAVADAERWLAARQQEPGATDPLPPATPPSSART
jgi:SulP family sulfate permease